MSKIGGLQKLLSVSTVWFILGFIVNYVFNGSLSLRGESLLWFTVLWGVSLLNLLLLGAVLSKLQLIIRENDPIKRLKSTLEAFFWGFLKFLCLALIGFLLYRYTKVIPTLPLVTGLLTLVIIPSVGGWWWSLAYLRAEKEKQNAS